MEYRVETKFKKTEIGLIPEDWEVKKLSEIVHINPNRFLSFSEYAKFIPMDALEPFNKHIKYFLKRKHSGGPRFKNKDTILAKITPCLENGKTAYINNLNNKEIAFGSSEFIVFSEKENVSDSEYVYYKLISPDFRKAAIKSMVGTSGRQRVQLDVIKNFLTTIPKLKEQKTIAGILKSLDDKIELNNQINQTLEQIAQSIFKHWFIDFEFPNEQGLPYKSSGGEMVESELGEIPKGWKAGFINSFQVETVSGDWGSDKSNNETDLKIGCIRGTDLFQIQSGKLIELPQRFISRNKAEKNLLAVGDIIIEISGGSTTQSTGRSLFINKEILDFYKNKLTASNFCKILKIKDVSQSFYLFNLIKFLYRNGHFFNFEIGTTGIKNLDLKYLLSRFLINIPDESTINKYFDICYILDKNIYNNANQNNTLSQIRDTLLPKLMTGKIRVNPEE